MTSLVLGLYAVTREQAEAIRFFRNRLNDCRRARTRAKRKAIRALIERGP